MRATNIATSVPPVGQDHGAALATTAAIALSLGKIGSLSAPAHAQTQRGPLDQFLSPKLLDPAVSLLAALPTPYPGPCVGEENGDVLFTRAKTQLPTSEDALPGRDHRPTALPDRHRVLDAPLVTDEIPEGYAATVFGLGCFWGAEEIFWQVPGVWSTSVGYAGGLTPNPTYDEVCTGRTGHTEAVRVVYDPAQVSFGELVATFYEVHDPTQGMRQGNDVGTQYRSAIYVESPEQEQVAREVSERLQPELTRRGYGEITTEIKPAVTYYYAEGVHQQYLAKNPFGYRCHSATGIKVPR